MNLFTKSYWWKTTVSYTSPDYSENAAGAPAEAVLERKAGAVFISGLMFRF